jgi:hypothetical protein
MEHREFDHLIRSLATGVSRRSVLRRAAGSAVAGPIAWLGADAARADGKDKNKDKNKDKSKGGGAESLPASGCRDVGHPCEGNQECCAGLACVASGPGAALRCSSSGIGVPSTTAQTTQTAVQTSNQVCAGNCNQTTQQAVGGPLEQTVIAGGATPFGPAPSYWVDASCTYNGTAYQTICNLTGHGSAGAPRVQKITIPTSDICAIVVSEQMKPEAERPRNSTTTNVATGGQASAGNGGVANAEANGGSVSVGNVGGGNTNVSIDASGGTASANASGGNNNVATAGGGQAGSETAAQVTEPSVLTLTLEGRVVPGKASTYWLDTDTGRRPASGPSLVQVADDTPGVGAIVVEARACTIPAPQAGYDWFGQCQTAPDRNFSLYPQSGGTTPLATATTNAQGRARFSDLAPGIYQVKPEGVVWCYAESDRVDANGNVTVEADVESHVWSFTCGAPAGS